VLAFTLLALVLAGPVPELLARAKWPMRAPRAAVVLWQAIALAAVLSAVSAGIATAGRLFAAGPGDRPTATIATIATIASQIEVLSWPLRLLSVVVLAITLLIGTRLAIAVLRVAIATRRQRAHHRMLVDLLGVANRKTPDSAPSHLRILDVSEPLAYCLPGVRRRVVVSEGTLTTLSDNEVAAILSHERAHLRARHDLVLEMFTAVHAAFPRFVRSAKALDAVRLLVELLADDAAVQTAGPTPLARALVACASGPTPRGALGAGGPSTVLRIRRLGGPPNSTLLATAAYVAAAAVLIVPTVALAVPWLTEFARLFTV